MSGIILYKSKYGATKQYAEWIAVETVRQHNFKGDLEGIEFFYCRGKFDMKSMTFADRTLCKMLRKAVGKKNPSEYEIWEQALMACKEDERGDWVDRSYIEPIVKTIVDK